MKRKFAIIIGIAWFSSVFLAIGYLLSWAAMYVAIGIWLAMTLVSLIYSRWFFGSWKKAIEFSFSLKAGRDLLKVKETPKIIKLEKTFHEEERE